MRNKGKRKSGDRVLAEGKFLRLIERGSWEFVERTNCSGIVIILALTKERKIIFIEQYRVPVDKKVIEFPAGLIDDLAPLRAKETFVRAAKRELLEETGYSARTIRKITQGPVSGGLCADQAIICQALGLRKISEGGGDPTEAIIVHEVPLEKATSWLNKMRKKGCLVDPKVYMGLYFFTV